MGEKERAKIMSDYQARQRRLIQEYDGNDPHALETKQSKVARARLFGEWIIARFGLTNLQKHGVLDIAGGAGELSLVLSEHTVPVTIVDPRAPQKVKRREDKLKQDGLPI